MQSWTTTKRSRILHRSPPPQDEPRTACLPFDRPTRRTSPHQDSRSIPPPSPHHGRISNRSPQPITFVVRHGRAGGHRDAVVTSYRFAKGVSGRTAAGTGDHAAVEIRAKGWRERDGRGGWCGCWKGECQGRYCGEGEKYRGVEMRHRCGLGEEMMQRGFAAGSVVDSVAVRKGRGLYV